MKQTTKLPAAILKLVNSASQLGANFSGGLDAAVDAATQLVPANYLRLSDKQKAKFAPYLRAFGDAFIQGYLVTYLSNRGYGKRWGNYDRKRRLEAAAEIIAKPEPTSTKSNRRTDLEHKGVKAAYNGWTRVKDLTGRIKAPPVARPSARKGRKANAAGTGKVSNAPVSIASALSVPSRSIKNGEEAIQIFLNVANRLLETMNGNAAAVPTELKSVGQDFIRDVKTAVKELQARNRAAGKTPAAVVSRVKAIQPNGSGVTA